MMLRSMNRIVHGAEEQPGRPSKDSATKAHPSSPRSSPISNWCIWSRVLPHSARLARQSINGKDLAWTHLDMLSTLSPRARVDSRPDSDFLWPMGCHDALLTFTIIVLDSF